MIQARFTTKVPVDNYGQPFENAAAEDLFKLRENDPAQSLQWSMGDYAKAVRALHELTTEHDEALYHGAIEFVEKLEDLTARIENALAQVQFDVKRVAEQKNKGWYKAEKAGRSRARLFGRTGQAPFYLIGETPPVDRFESYDDLPALPSEN